LGLNHDRYVAGDVPAADYNFSYVMWPQAARTVMAYDNQCREAALAQSFKFH
jgi:hypothetical protein